MLQRQFQVLIIIKIIKKITKLHDKYLWTKSYKLSTVIPNVKETLNYLKKKYEIAVISNCSHKSIQRLLKGAGLNKKYFDFINR